MSSKRDNGGLSLQTLVIASLSSLAAALFIHKFWQGGAILGAAVTPVIVALVSEALRKPVDAVTARRTTVEPPPVVAPEREDRFGIWEEQKRRPRRRLHVGLAVATGLVAFAIAAFFLTGAELVLGGASNSDKFRVIPGKQKKGGSSERETPARTEPDQATPSPGDEEEAPEETVPEDAPPETAPPEETVPPEEEVPPAETAPPVDPGATAPAP